MSLNTTYTLSHMLKKLNVAHTDEHHIWIQCRLNRLVHIKKQARVMLYLETSKPLPLRQLDDFMSQIKNSLGINDSVAYRLMTDFKETEPEKLKKAPFFEENIHYVLAQMSAAAALLKDEVVWDLVNGELQLIFQDPTLERKAFDKRIHEMIGKMIANMYGVQLKCRIATNNPLVFDNTAYEKSKKALEKVIISDALVQNNGHGNDNSSVKKSNSSSQGKMMKTRNQGENGKPAQGTWVGKPINTTLQTIGELREDDTQATIKGDIFSVDVRVLKNDRKLYIFDLTDYTGSITAKLFEPKKTQVNLEELLKSGTTILVRGSIQFDHYSKENILMVSDIMPHSSKPSTDNAPDKRIEFHCHTNMSQMDGICSPTSVIAQAAKWGHSGIAITDHGVVQAFPEAAAAGKKHGIRIFYGMEGYLVDDEMELVTGADNHTFEDAFVVFDIETTGLSNAHDRITEIGAVRVENGEIVGEYCSLINPEKLISSEITELTGITNEMVKDAPLILEELPRFIDFCKGAVLVAHNADFDAGFIRENMRRIGMGFNFPVLDTLALSRILLKELKRHKLNLVAKALQVNLENHHRAIHDARATAEVFLKLVQRMKEQGINSMSKMNQVLTQAVDVSRLKPYHVILLVQNQKGLRNLYEIVSESHMKYFYKKPRIPKSLLNRKREGLFVGTACQAGELYQAVLNREPETKLTTIAAFYDYLEVQPTSNNAFLIDKGLAGSREELMEINKRIIQLGDQLNKPVLATGDAHYTRACDDLFRQVLQAGMGFDDTEDPALLNLKTTTEMLEEFSYLGKERAEEIVIVQPRALASQIEDLVPVPEGTFPPFIDGSEEQLEKLCRTKAAEIYGDPLPDLVEKRLERELRSIIDNGYAVMYMIAHKLVAKSLSDGYLVGSRGSVGSSFAATMSGITEVNPLAPHYVCPACRHSQFFTEGEVESGADLPDQHCSNCGTQYRKEGHSIPFEVFLGFEGDKEPDIDLNFAGEYQATAHQYIEHLFGESKVFRAGTIGTIANKTAYGYVKKFGEEKGIQHSNAEVKRLTEGCTGVKKTTGQHPGGVMIVPADRDIHEFTPIQYPANDKKSGVITTHFDYHALSGRLLKLDILGHDVPTMIRMLEDFTDTNALEIPLDDQLTKSIFVGAEALNFQDERFSPELGSIAIPEFGTKFVRQMLQDTQPETFGELVRISGLSHGTDVWLNNAQELVRNGVASLKEVICTRDDIMNYLILKGLPSKSAFKIMENVRKGKGVTEDEMKLMAENQVPQWYIDSCNKIKYMFPKAHAVAYVMMSFRIAWYKVHYPEAFYATYFSMKVEDFDAHLMIQGIDAVMNKLKELENLGNQATAKEKNQMIVLEVALEMFSREIEMLQVNLYASHPEQFIIEKNKVLPPLSSLQGVGQNAARRISEEREKGDFLSLEDLRQRTGASKVVIETLRNHGACHDLPETNQLSLFNLPIQS
ncbi:PolC-type DNA polymerase III [Anoxynatronum buryatiense]|uniref:DNA polymerase III PolC-type n=1 Tax=Anoxynatronum buryatiense TaxID=489973 RepID=A0AA45WUR8_9CLOT|nr:PolC-type DNA polymerase III [Anoxynatronum buryatiense]SMP47504.1 DNA polymerase-3 subunit alpha [Anoxynatronum buryatiense]